jgi:hypothetical protein
VLDRKGQVEKKVHFEIAIGTGDEVVEEANEREATVYQTQKTKKEWTNVRLRRYIDDRFSHGEDEQIFRDFKIFEISPQRVHDFLCDYLYVAATAEKEAHWLNFIAKNISTEDFHRLLADSDFRVLKVFAMDAYILEISSLYMENEKRFRVEKFKVLLLNANDLVSGFMEKCQENPKFQKAWGEYMRAKEELGDKLFKLNILT